MKIRRAPFHLLMRNSVDRVEAERFQDEFCRAVQEVAPNAELVGKDVAEYCAYHEDLPDDTKCRIFSLVGQRMSMSGIWARRHHWSVPPDVPGPNRLGSAERDWIYRYISEHPDWSVKRLREDVKKCFEGRKISLSIVYSYLYQTYHNLHRQQKKQRRREPAQDPKLEKTEEPSRDTADEAERESQESQNYSELFDDVLPYCW